MKKFFAILLLTIYSAGLAGATINYHYCRGHLVKISLLNLEKPKTCNCDPAQMPENCCGDKLVHQQTDIHQVAPVVSLAEIVSHDFYSPAVFNQVIGFPKDGLNNDILNEFSDRTDPHPAFLLNRVFRK